MQFDLFRTFELERSERKKPRQEREIREYTGRRDGAPHLLSDLTQTLGHLVFSGFQVPDNFLVTQSHGLKAFDVSLRL